MIVESFGRLPGFRPKDIIPILKDIATIDKIGIAKDIVDAFNETVNVGRINRVFCRQLAVRKLGPGTKLFLD